MPIIYRYLGRPRPVLCLIVPLLLFSDCLAFSQLTASSQQRHRNSMGNGFNRIPTTCHNHQGDKNPKPLYNTNDTTEQALSQSDRKIPSFVYKLNASTKWIVTIANTIGLWGRPANFQGPFIVLGSILSVYFTAALKNLINQGRPAGAPFADPGMPSSHSLVTFFSVAAWVSVLPVSTASLAMPLLWAGASAVALLRVICGYHSYAQIGVGATLGSFLGWAWIAGGNAMHVANPRLTFLVSWVTYLVGAFFYISRDMRKWIGKEKHL